MANQRIAKAPIASAPIAKAPVAMAPMANAPTACLFTTLFLRLIRNKGLIYAHLTMDRINML